MSFRKLCSLIEETHSVGEYLTLSLILMLIIGSAALSVSQPYLFKLIIDSMNTLEGINKEDIEFFLLIYISIVASSRIVKYLYQPIFTKYTLNLQRKLSINSLNHMLRMDFDRFNKKEITSLPKIVGDSNIALHTWVSALFEIALPVVLESLFIMFMIYFILGEVFLLVALLGAVIFILVTIVGSNKIQRFQKEYTEIGNKNFALLSEPFLNIETVRMFVAEKVFIQRYLLGMSKYIEKCMKFFTGSCVLGIAQVLLLVGIMAIMLTMLLDKFHAGEASVGDFVILNLFAIQLVVPLQNIAVAYRMGKQSIIEINIRNRILETHPVEKNCGETLLPVDASYKIEFRNVSYTYPGAGSPTIENFSCQIKAGSSVLLKGRSGVGKSTIIRLLLRMLVPCKGRILINGVDIQNIELSHLRRKVGYIPQDVSLFDESLEFNIKLGRKASQDTTSYLAELGVTGRFLKRMYDNAGFGGKLLSGGERQRISIARALYLRPPILVLDEPTSALDTDTQNKIIDRLECLFENHTVIIISHRDLSGVNFDQIINLDYIDA